MLPTHQKALILESKNGQFTVKTIHVPKPGPGEILARVEAAALNPIDWKIQAFGMFVENYPTTTGTDGAGVVVGLGEGVTSFAVGDRICWQSNIDYVGKKIIQGTFVQYAVVPIMTAMKVPANIPIDVASSLSTALPAAAFPMYNENKDPSEGGLLAPWTEGGKGAYASKSALVIGGSSSVGQYAIQLLRLSGVSTIVATASPKHADHLKSLGATHVVDRSLPEDAMKAEVTAPLSGGVFDIVQDLVCSPETTPFGYWLTAPEGDFYHGTPFVKIPSEGIKRRTHFSAGALTGAKKNELIPSYLSSVPKLLETGDIKPNRIEVLPGGLHAIPEGLERIKAGKVSGIKLVVLPQETAS